MGKTLGSVSASKIVNSGAQRPRDLVSPSPSYTRPVTAKNRRVTGWWRRACGQSEDKDDPSLLSFLVQAQAHPRHRRQGIERLGGSPPPRHAAHPQGGGSARWGRLARLVGEGNRRRRPHCAQRPVPAGTLFCFRPLVRTAPSRSGALSAGYASPREGKEWAAPVSIRSP